MKIVFLGTPDFAVPSLEILVKHFTVSAVVTTPDRPAGRGLQPSVSPVKACALRHGIPVLQPEKLKDPAFIDSLRVFKADVQVVVAFRMLPEAVWSMPPLGTWNLHASLLPQYRGAAPIHHAIINGETETGLTTFKLSHAIDTGDIALQEKLSIGPEETTGELHDRMMEAGAVLLLETVKRIENGTLKLTRQSELIEGTLKEAPKLFPDFCRISFSQPVNRVYNHIRGLSPFPGATAQLMNGNGNLALKLFRSRLADHVKATGQPGDIRTDKDHIYVYCADGWLEILELQLAGKKRLAAGDFLRGFRLEDGSRML